MVIIKKIIHILAIITYICIGVYLLVCSPMILGYTPVVVLSGSMEPTIKEKSIIYYSKVDTSTLKEKDIITFKKDKDLVTHRIVSITDDEIYTKGDANNTNDPGHITKSDVIGKIGLFSIPFVGFYIWYVNSNMLLSIITAVLILLSEFFLTNMKTLGEKKKGNDKNERKENE
jgi:signal peptidase